MKVGSGSPDLVCWSDTGLTTTALGTLCSCAESPELVTSLECWPLWVWGPHCCPLYDPSDLVLHLIQAWPGAWYLQYHAVSWHMRPTPGPHEVLLLLHWFTFFSGLGATAPIPPSSVFPSNSAPQSGQPQHSFEFSCPSDPHKSWLSFVFCFAKMNDFPTSLSQLVCKSVYPQMESNDFNDFVFPLQKYTL